MRARWYTSKDAVVSTAPDSGACTPMTGHLALPNGTRLALKDGFVLGRVAGCDLVIDDTKASRRHAKFVVEAGVVEIEDLQSSNGTLLNDKPVTRRVLREGDRIRIGKTVLVFHEGDVPGAARTAGGGTAANLDDNDLFDGGSPSPASAVAPPRAQPAPTRPEPPPTVRASATPIAASPSLPPPAPGSPAPSPPPPQPAPLAPPTPSSPPPERVVASPPPVPRPSVVEFADEVVEVKKPAAKSEPAIAAKAIAGSGPAAVSQSSRVLQFHKRPGGAGGLLGDDMGQMSGAMRALLVVGVLALGAGIVFVVMQLMK